MGVEIADKTKSVRTCGEAKSGRVHWKWQVFGRLLPKRSGPKKYCGRCSIEARLERNARREQIRKRQRH